jgi:hypothetical protein
MPGFLYFAPNCTKTVTRDDVKAWCLDYAFTATPTSVVCLSNTPTGGAGVIFADEKRLGEYTVGMNLEEQEWRKIPKSDCYVGYWKVAPPVPEDLLRTPQLPGYLVPLGGQEWTVPVTARFDETRKQLVTALPCYVQLDEQGNWNEGDVLSVHEQLWNIGQPFRDDLMRRLVEGGDPTDFTRQELFDAAVSYLQANYVVSAAELSMMKTFTTDSAVHGAILAANDYFTFERWDNEQKKSTQSEIAAGSNSANGEAG